MTTYKSIVGKNQRLVQTHLFLEIGQIWYNTTTGTLRGVPILEARNFTPLTDKEIVQWINTCRISI